jgi:flagellar motor switch protein FliM
VAEDSPLSQEELDVLLGGLGDKPAGVSMADAGAGGGSASVGAGPQPKGKVKTYDFRRPDRFSKDHIRTLEMIHDSYARFLQSAISTYLRSVVEIKVSQVRQQTYEEFISGLSNPTSLNIFSMEPLKGSAILDINAELMFAMIDRVLGGPGLVPKKIRELTSIEIPVAERIVVRALDSLREAWQKVAPIIPKLEMIESNPGFVQIAAPSEIVATISMDLKVKEQTGRMHLCLPYVLLEPIAPKLLAREWISSGQKGPTSESMVNLKRSLGDTLLGVAVVLGRARTTLKDIMALKKGDIIRLDRGVQDELMVEVEGREKFMGRPGVRSRKNAVMITSIVTPPEDTF